MDSLAISGVYDLHLHCGPEAIPRKHDFLELSTVLKKSGMGGAVVKSHFHSTAPWAYMAAVHGEANLFGAITLNHYVGGINPDAVLGSLGIEFEGKPCLKVVWMPTLHSKGHIEMQLACGQLYDIPAEWTGGIISKGRQKLCDVEPITLFDEGVGDRLLKVLSIIA
jgi:hypothetical protein